MNQLQTLTSKQLFEILQKSAEIHDGERIRANKFTNLEIEELIVDIIPYLEQAMEELGYRLEKI